MIKKINDTKKFYFFLSGIYKNVRDNKEKLLKMRFRNNY